MLFCALMFPFSEPLCCHDNSTTTATKGRGFGFADKHVYFNENLLSCSETTWNQNQTNESR